MDSLECKFCTVIVQYSLMAFESQFFFWVNNLMNIFLAWNVLRFLVFSFGNLNFLSYNYLFKKFSVHCFINFLVFRTVFFNPVKCYFEPCLIPPL